MKQQEGNSSSSFGLHRPFNMPLKSLVWVCRFSKGYKQRKGHDFYLDFFLWMLSAVIEHEGDYEASNSEGIIKPDTSHQVLSVFANNSYNEKKRIIREILSKRDTSKEKIIYSCYKNTSYYITLAKKLNLIDRKGQLSPIGKELANVRDYYFYQLADKHKIIIFRSLHPLFLENLVIIGQCHQLVDDMDIGSNLFRAYLKSQSNEFEIKYITSFDENYFKVLFHWVKTLGLYKGVGAFRNKYNIEIEELGLSSQYLTLVREIESFYKQNFRKRIKLEDQYEKIRKVYFFLQKKKQTDYGYVNLYDIKKSFRLSYESFNELLNSYYTAYRHIEIILFSNTVSSIDMRRRFFVAGNSVLKIKIIQRSKL